MKYLKRFNESVVTKEEIIRQLELIAPSDIYSDNDELEGRITLNPDGTVDVEGHIMIHTDRRGPAGQLEKLPFQFGRVTGNFIISPECMNLKTLEGSPHECLSFQASELKITSLIGSPIRVHSQFKVDDCKGISSLEGSPRYVTTFIIEGTRVTSLQGGPEEVVNYFCERTLIENFIGLPTTVKRLVANYCHRLTSLEGLPKFVEQIYLNSFEGNLPRLWDPTPLKDCQFQTFFLRTATGGTRPTGSPLAHLIEAFNPDLKNYMSQLGVEEKKQVMQNFRDSLDYNYIRGDAKKPQINLFRFKEALAEFDMTEIKNGKVIGYNFVDDMGRTVNFRGGLIPDWDELTGKRGN